MRVFKWNLWVGKPKFQPHSTMSDTAVQTSGDRSFWPLHWEKMGWGLFPTRDFTPAPRWSLAAVRLPPIISKNMTPAHS